MAPRSRLLALFVAIVLVRLSAPAWAQAARVPPNDASDYQTGAALCTKGDAKACNVVGAMFATGVHGVKLDAAQAFPYFDKACAGGYAIGCANLANAYYNGLGVTMARTKSIAVYQRACDLGAVTACVDLGVIYRDGKGDLEKNQTYAAQLFQRACNLNAPACASIASMYELGWGVSKDLVLAKTLYQKSCYAPRSDSAEDVQRIWSRAACNVVSRMSQRR
ncbi:MAG TPA: tetratricopeptide repeat protein [Vicinamibacterales bacterium]|nr:tetratricopeptide repeat protein [Vicinamibacterales bacterium]